MSSYSWGWRSYAAPALLLAPPAGWALALSCLSALVCALEGHLWQVTTAVRTPAQGGMGVRSFDEFEMFKRGVPGSTHVHTQCVTQTAWECPGVVLKGMLVLGTAAQFETTCVEHPVPRR